jgi:ribosome-associated translation inhibitor RaiA
MSFPIQITFRHMESSIAVESRIRDECTALERYFPRIVSGRIVVEAPHRHQQQGNDFRISIHLAVPRSEIVVKHEPSLHSTLVRQGAEESEKHLETQPEHKDIYVSVRDAFDAARRQLEDYSRKLRGDVKSHAADAAGESAAG